METLRFLVGLFLSLLLSQCLATVTDTVLVSDKQALLNFAKKVPHLHTLNWDERTSVCKNWTGIACNEDGSRVISLRLPGVGFRGPIPSNTLTNLSALQILSLRSNCLTGTFPLDLLNLKNLSSLFLQYNNFTGSLPLNFSVWKNLTSVDLSNNRFNGSIPTSISSLTHLISLNLANNSFSGEIPDFELINLSSLNLSYNNLTGLVPKSLQKFPKTVFSGNNLTTLNLLNSSIPVLPYTHDPNEKSSSKRKLSEKALLWIIITSSVLGVFGLLFLIIIYRSKRKNNTFSGKLTKGDMSPDKSISRIQEANNRLIFFEGCNYAFDLEDLLRASAEVLGKGTFGMAYKAILEDATNVVVKRLKEVSVGKKEFEQQMDIVGRIKDENVVELRAYYYSKDEKLMVYDYFSDGSVATLLHGKKGEDKKTPLDWETRVKIVHGAAKGIVKIHTQNNGKFVHGNIKSSNIFLNSEGYGTVSDLGMATIMTPQIARTLGYRAPEIPDARKATQASDVYSFGVLVLELLTGKSPVHTTRGDEVIHLVRWVHSVVREEWTGEVFDLELMKYPNIEEEMVEMLRMALACVVRNPDQRPKMVDVVKMIENLRLPEGENRLSSDIGPVIE